MNLPFLLNMNAEERLKFKYLQKYFSQKLGKQTMVSTLRLLVNSRYDGLMDQKREVHKDMLGKKTSD